MNDKETNEYSIELVFKHYNWVKRDVVLKNSDGRIMFELKDVEAPDFWSDTAVKILAQKYFYKGYGYETKEGDNELSPCVIAVNAITRIQEISLKQVVKRLTNTWAHYGYKLNYFTDYDEAIYFRNSIAKAIVEQVVAPNSPQWFNTGIYHMYAYKGPVDVNRWAIGDDGNIFDTKCTYERPQVHACFINGIEDSLNGITDLVKTEARLFKLGSGSGANYSNLRGAGERLSGGGTSSGLMSFLPIGDRSAGSIKSGGTSRRAARMVSVDLDHPDIESFIDWKPNEEMKAVAIDIGSHAMHEAIETLKNSKRTNKDIKAAIKKGGRWAIETWLRRASHGDDSNFIRKLPVFFESEAMDTVSGQNSNNTIRVTNGFMKSVADGSNANVILYNRTDGSVAKNIPANELWQKICSAAYMSADPGLHFSDSINDMNTCPHIGDIHGSNPCSEYVFLDNTACNLASINLGKLWLDTSRYTITECLSFVGSELQELSRLLTIMLDISISMASYPTKKMASMAYNTRTIGLGYTNIGGLLLKLGVPYNSRAAADIAEFLTAVMNASSMTKSGELAKKLGSYVSFNPIHHEDVLNKYIDRIDEFDDTQSVIHNILSNPIVYDLYNQALGYIRNGFMRNAQHTLIAPTGTIGLVMDVDTTGIEPIYSLYTKKSLAGGGSLSLGIPAANDLIAKQKNSDEIIAYIDKHGTIVGAKDELDISDNVYDCLLNANEIGVDAHLNVMAAAQRHLSGAISKTINLPANCTIEDISNAYIGAWKRGIKAIALYRDGSKATQPLSSIDDALSRRLNEIEREQSYTIPEEVQSLASSNAGQEGCKRKKLPYKRSGTTTKFTVDGISYYLTANTYPTGKLGEIWFGGSDIPASEQGLLDTISKLFSVALQHGIPLEVLVNTLVNRGSFPPNGMVQNHDKIKLGRSVIDVAMKDLAIEHLGWKQFANVDTYTVTYSDISEEPADELHKDIKESANEIKYVARNTGEKCPECGSDQMVQNGTCHVCSVCGTTTGCG